LSVVLQGAPLELAPLLPPNFGLGQNVDNDFNVVYYGKKLIMIVKSFIVQTHGALFFFEAYE